MSPTLLSALNLVAFWTGVASWIAVGLVLVWVTTLGVVRLTARARTALRRPVPVTAPTVQLPVVWAPNHPKTCPDCWAPPGAAHHLSCPEVSPEQMRAFLNQPYRSRRFR